MADEVDLTDARVEKEMASIIDAHVNRSVRAQVYDEYGVVVCADCGGEMPMGRILAGYANCVGCQTEREKKTRRF